MKPAQPNCGVNDQQGRQFSGGEASVYGPEMQFAQRYPLNLQVDIPYSFTYTYTSGEFESEQFTKFAQWGHIKTVMNILPDHQATLTLVCSE